MQSCSMLRILMPMPKILQRNWQQVLLQIIIPKFLSSCRRTAKAVRAPRARRGPVPQPFEAQQVEVAAVSQAPQAPQAPVPQSAEDRWQGWNGHKCFVWLSSFALLQDMEEHLSPESSRHVFESESSISHDFLGLYAVYCLFSCVNTC